MNEKEKMIAGMNYNPLDPQLILLRDRASRLCHRYNKKTFHEVNLRSRLLRKLLQTEGNFWVKPPFYCDYGFNITLGNDTMLNYGCVLLDVCPITIGDKTLIGPNVQLPTACHSLDPKQREQDVEFGKPIKIGRNVWIGGGAIVCPGVTIRDNTVIGAGSVVTKSMPANVIAYGNPCRVHRRIDLDQKPDEF
ncbi:sugar O-acetyltransferase [Holdemania filiformis]|uniref:sugar O-acetyltransferase n=1 Tax=Holdemania filiformis TaxID=61171 RepID=UPI002430E41C|nr:sugar O-acetyltransferase [Holdemania filiformis]